jgi:putative membrane protein
MALLSETDRRRVEDKIADIEKRTAGEIVVSVVGRSDDYAGPRVAYAALLALLSAAIGHLIWIDLEATWFLAAQLPVAVLAFVVLGSPGLLRIVVPRDERCVRVEQRAERAFLERAVFDTRDRSGVLILLSELERHAVILGDRGIHERVTHVGWQRHVAHLTQRVREGRTADGLCEVLDALGELFARDFPPRPDDVDELANHVVIEDR